MPKEKILSTGVLVRDPICVNAHIDVANIDSAISRNVSVEILDWGIDQVWNNPTPLSVSPSGSVAVGPHTHQSFLALITQSTAQPMLALALYEIRVTVPDDGPLTINCFGLDANGHIVAGNTVRHNQLVELTPSLTRCCCLNSIAGLRALAAGAFQCVTLLGYYVAGDGGGGDFYWDAAASDADDAGTVIVPASNPPTGRWKRSVLGALSVKAFGAKGDAGDDTKAVQTAIDSGLGTVTFPPGIYRIKCGITVSTACRLIGLGSGPGGNSTVGNNDERGAILEWGPPVLTDSMFLITGVDGNVTSGVGTTFENLLFRQVAGNGAGAQGSAIRIGNQLTTDNFKPSWTRIRNCTFETGIGKDDWTLLHISRRFRHLGSSSGVGHPRHLDRECSLCVRP